MPTAGLYPARPMLPLRQALARRLLLQRRAASDAGWRDAALEACRRDVVLWVQDWAWTFDPRNIDCPYLPMELFPRQVEYLRWRDAVVAAREHGIVEKSRDMGVSWLNALWHLHRWLFCPGYVGAFNSRIEDDVDDGTPDSIMGKMDVTLERLPHWMIPDGYNRRLHRSHLRISHPTSGAIVIGESGPNAGRGGRSTVRDSDEHAHLIQQDRVEAAISQNSDVIFRSSTPCGEGNAFHRLRMSGELPVFTFHWRDDPRKGEEWYAATCRRLGDPILIAQELDISYSGSVDGIVVPSDWVRPALSRPIYTDERDALVLGVDVARFGGDCTAVVAREGRNVLHVERWQGHDLMETVGRVVATADRLSERLNAVRRVRPERLYLVVDSTGVGGGVADRLREVHQERQREGRRNASGGCPWVVLDCDAGASSPVDTCARTRDHLWWESRAYWGESEPAISDSIPAELRDALVQQLSGPRYSYTSTGQVLVESKDKMKARGVKSPDVADAFNLTLHADVRKPMSEREAGPRWMRQGRRGASGMV